MERAIALAELGRGYTSPNPLVGAVVVKRNRLIAEAYHQRYGGPHAEALALRRAGALSKGATLYVTLEPCVHFGKTPPCADQVIESGVKRVVIGMRDPNPLVWGRGILRLRRAGLDVKTGVCREKVRRQNAWYVKYITRGIPWVLLKLAVTLDGRIAPQDSTSRWITGHRARRFAHRLRREADAVLVGIGTVLADDPRLTVREVKGRDPIRVVLDPELRIPEQARILHPPGRVIIFCRKGAGPKGPKRPGVEIVPVAQREYGLDWGEVLKELGSRGVANLLIEGGVRVASSALKAGIVDGLFLFYGPMLMGAGRSFTDELHLPGLGSAIPVQRLRIRRLEPDILIEGELSSRG